MLPTKNPPPPQRNLPGDGARAFAMDYFGLLAAIDDSLNVAGPRLAPRKSERIGRARESVGSNLVVDLMNVNGKAPVVAFVTLKGTPAHRPG